MKPAGRREEEEAHTVSKEAREVLCVGDGEAFQQLYAERKRIGRHLFVRRRPQWERKRVYVVSEKEANPSLRGRKKKE